jgi:hypothetical protein
MRDMFGNPSLIELPELSPQKFTIEERRVFKISLLRKF